MYQQFVYKCVPSLFSSNEQIKDKTDYNLRLGKKVFLSFLLLMEVYITGFSINSGVMDDAGNPDFEQIDDFGIQSSRWQAQLGVRYIFN